MLAQFDALSSTSASPAIAFIALLGLVTSIFWMVVGWRAMRAHEGLAEATKRMAGSE